MINEKDYISGFQQIFLATAESLDVARNYLEWIQHITAIKCGKCKDNNSTQKLFDLASHTEVNLWTCPFKL
jgi:hypothetical protein